MTTDEMAAMREIIVEKIAENREEIESHNELTKPVAPDNAIGRLSRMDAINNKTINEAALRENRRKLQKLERALENLENDLFGKCTKCCKEIAFGRLKFTPWTTRCVSCA
jgi:DnaK suppressor protein